MSVSEQQLQNLRGLMKAGENGRAEALARQLLRRAPGEPIVVAELARALARQGKSEQALYLAKSASGSKSVEAVEVAAAVLRQLGDVESSLACLRRVTSLEPGRAYGHNALGIRLLDLRRLDEARASLHEAYSIDPADPAIAANYAMALSETWSLEAALEVLRAARVRHPESALVQHQVPFLSNYSDWLGAMEVFAEHRRFGELLGRTAQELADPPLHRPTIADAERMLRVGLLSADFREHAVSRFVESIVQGHDPARVHFTLYPVVPGEDATTQRLRSMCEGWSQAAMQGDLAAAAAIRRERMDILIDLAGLTRGMRAGLLMARAAPLQVTYLGYPNTTALRNVDARIVDSITDPPGAESLATERLLRLDPCFLCFTPPPAANDIPARGPAADQAITFGSFNLITKITPTTIELWAAILERVPGSRLLLKATALSHEGVRARLLEGLGERGIGRERVELVPFVDELAEHYRLYHRVDIALDTFPYHGTTTTCEAVYMGVPVITMTGDRHASRVGTSILKAVGIPELVAANREEYIQKAVELAESPARRSAYHRELRDRLCASAVGDGAGFSARFEGVLRAAWQALARGG